MEQFFVVLNTILFLCFKQIFDAVTALDGRPIDFKVLQNFLRLFIFCLGLVSTNSLFFFLIRFWA